MKKFFLTILSSAAIFISQAGVQFPTNFVKSFTDQPDQLEGWTVYAPEGSAIGNMTQFFPNYSAKNPISILRNEYYGAWTLSQYSNGQESDTWLITPEIEVKYDQELLSFGISVFGMGSSITNTFFVYISESGVNKEDFTLFNSGTIKGSAGGANYVNSSSFRYALSGYKGKTIRLAFVNQGNVSGMMGFENINLSNWYGEMDKPSDYYNNVILAGNGLFDNIMKISTPVQAKGYTLEFETAGGFRINESTESRTFRINSLTQLPLNITNIPVTQEVDAYKLTFTPNFEGAEPLIITGNFLQVNRIYDYVGVLEEATGTWCGWCPFGAAGLMYYTEKYNGENGSKRVIPIAIHGSDPMEIPGTISDFCEAWMENDGNGGFPSIAINRQVTVTPSPDPRNVGTNLEKLFSSKSYATTELTDVYYNEEQGRSMWATYTLTSGFNAPEDFYAASVIITENDVQGRTPEYNQESYLAQQGYNENWVVNNLGDEWVPYFENYFGTNSVQYSRIQYPHVARAAYPSYYGEKAPAIGEGTVYSGKIKFEMPTNVAIPQNTSVVLVIRNASNGEIVAADVKDYYEFITDGVAEVMEENNVSAAIENGSLIVSVADNAEVEVYGIDGMKVMAAKAQAGVNSFTLDKNNRMLIVTVKGANGTKQFKLLNR